MAITSGIDHQNANSSKPADQIDTPTNSKASSTMPVEDNRLNRSSQHNETKQHATGNRYFAALALLAVVIPMPFLTTLATLIVYFTPSSFPTDADISKHPIILKQIFQLLKWLGPADTVFILGILITLIIWLLLAVPCRFFATAAGGRPSDYDGLKRAVEVMRQRLNILKKNEQVSEDKGKGATFTEEGTDGKQNITTEQDLTIEQKKARDIAISDIKADLDHIDDSLNNHGLQWLSTGYVSMWDRVNKADEAMIDVLPAQIVIESAKIDELRLNNSDVPNSDDLLKLLDKAITTLSSEKVAATASSDRTDSRQPSVQIQKNDLQQMLVHVLAFFKKGPESVNPPATTTKDDPPQSEQQARADIRKVRSALHDFTNKRWDGLVRARNILVITAFLTAAFTYVLVALAILAQLRPTLIEQAMVLYFLGAIVGLFDRLREEKDTDNVVDDYGLTMARIIVTPLLSGLAALVGVFLVTILSITITSQTSGGTSAGSMPPVIIEDIYNFIKYPQNLVFAAIFGYLPNLVLNILQSKSEDIKSQLKSATPSNVSASKGNGNDSSAKGKSNGSSS